MADSCEGVVSFGVCIPKQSCQYVMKIPRQYRCQFAKQTEDCRDTYTLLDYSTFILCKFNDFDYHIYFAYVLLVLYLIWGFIVLSTITHYFFPSLCYLVTLFGIPRNIAGATLIAWGFAAPNLIMLMTGALRGSWEFVLCQVVGVGVYELTCLVALISIIKPFFIRPSLFFRLTIFYVAVVIVLALTNLDDYIFMYEAIAYLVVYSIEMIVELIDDVVSSALQDASVITLTDLLVKDEYQEDDVKKIRSGSEPPDVRVAKVETRQEVHDKYITTTHHKRPTTSAMHLRQSLDSQLVDLPPPQVPRNQYMQWESSRNALLHTVRMQTLQQCGYRNIIDAERNTNRDVIAVHISGFRIVEKKKALLLDFLCAMVPLYESQWKRYNLVEKIGTVITCPIVYFCKVFIPCVDEGVLTNNWCKLLSFLQCFTAPLLLWAMLSRWYEPLTIAFFTATLSFAIVAAALLCRSSRVSRAPPYHVVFVFAGFVMWSALVFYVANEIVRVVELCAFVLSIRPPTLWMTVLAWGTSVGDTANCINVTRAGYPRVAIACICRNNLMLVTVGVACAFLYIILARGESFGYSENESIEVIYVGFFYLIATQAFTLLLIPSLDFRFRRSFAVFLLVAYFMFLLHCFLCELKLLASIA